MEKAIQNYLNIVVSANDLNKVYSTTIPSYNKTFFCIECGEYVSFVRRNKHNSYFRHSNINETTRDCELRAKVNPNCSIYETKGLPLYLKKCENRKFELYIGFYGINQSIIKTAKSEQCKISIKSSNERAMLFTNYLIDENEFSVNFLTLKRINFIARKYKITYSSPKVESLLVNKWGKECEGILDSGTLFVFGQNGGRKIRVNDEITTETDYYCLCDRKIEFNKYDSIQYDMCGEVVLKTEVSNLNYYVYRLKFVIDRKDQFYKLSNFCRENFKLSLLYTPSPLIPMWPPIAQKDNQLSFIKMNSYGMFILKGESTNACVFTHKNKSIDELKGEKINNHNYLIKVPIKELEKTAVSINNKRSSISALLGQYYGDIKEYTNSIYIQDNNNLLVDNGVYFGVPNKHMVKIFSQSRCNIIHLRKNILYRIYKISRSEGISIEDILLNDEILATDGIKYLPLLKYIKKGEQIDYTNIINLNDDELYLKLYKSQGLNMKVTADIKSILLSLTRYPKTFALIRGFMFNNKIPISAYKELKLFYNNMKDGDYYGR